jgi:hypothetical protein
MQKFLHSASSHRIPANQAGLAILRRILHLIHDLEGYEVFNSGNVPLVSLLPVSFACKYYFCIIIIVPHETISMYSKSCMIEENTLRKPGQELGFGSGG